MGNAAFNSHHENDFLLFKLTLLVNVLFHFMFQLTVGEKNKPVYLMNNNINEQNFVNQGQYGLLTHLPPSKVAALQGKLEVDIPYFVVLFPTTSTKPALKEHTNNLRTYIQTKNHPDVRFKKQQRSFAHRMVYSRNIQWRYILHISDFPDAQTALLFTKCTKAKQSEAENEQRNKNSSMPINQMDGVPSSAQRYIYLQDYAPKQLALLQRMRSVLHYPTSLIAVLECLWLPQFVDKTMTLNWHVALFAIPEEIQAELLPPYVQQQIVSNENNNGFNSSAMSWLINSEREQKHIEFGEEFTF